ncbi:MULTISPECIES: hypothetical protein [Chryseobacterium]|uniref:DUF3106 domain-containing protein n=1 Tax=Chryseobacterium gambrini TaxID=373672 RepID=A0AAJ1R4L6_9FLAO|nr:MULTISPECIES: hypothetical protein [Chryseobacterium]MDN4013916.1 hypothetical protein [Chryseobacterium gambrini]MDN4031244.1 hypothetical protein [Chryseobacterium gambrini]QWA39591.1 hypothetical protein KKI44_05120 [Chryseobacterium sp. ZHDP1]
MKKLIITMMLVGTFGLSYAQTDYYNDYRRSITDVNWQSVISDLVLSTTQANQIYALNDRYRDYDSWNRVYDNNPDRWRNDRYVELERILGRDKYAKFKNRYYKGQNPVAVYNRNKNNDKRYKHMDKKAKVYRHKNGKGHH